MAANGKAAAAYGTGRSASGHNGYVRIWCPGHPLAMKDGYVYEHRYVWHDHYGDVPPGFEVHHKDLDRANNDISNLELLSEDEHLAEHNAIGVLRRNQHGISVIGAGYQVRTRLRREAAGDRRCERCDDPINHLRLDARFCGGRCRDAASKARRKAA